MPANHGIYRKLPTTAGQPLTAAEVAVFRYGLFQIFQALKAGDFLTPEERQRAAQLEHHFRTVCQRFVFTLQELNQLMQDLALSYSSPDFGVASMKLHFQAECLADHVLTYLNVIVDDVAIVTALATGLSSASPIDNMSTLKSKGFRNDPALFLSSTSLTILAKRTLGGNLVSQKRKVHVSY